MKASVLDSQSYYRYEQIKFDESCSLQFEHLENPDVRLLSEKIDANTRTIYGGLMGVLYNVSKTVDTLTELVLSLSLTVGRALCGSLRAVLRLLGVLKLPAVGVPDASGDRRIFCSDGEAGGNPPQPGKRGAKRAFPWKPPLWRLWQTLGSGYDDLRASPHRS